VSTVVKHMCDICGVKTEESMDYTFWGRYRDAEGREYEVCGDCQSRLMQPKDRRERHAQRT
jgi:hypothetical protein